MPCSLRAWLLPIGPGTTGTTDTIVQRQADCAISLATAGSNCTIPIELVALSLISTVDPLVRVRESPTLASAGMMTMTSDGSGSGGTFNSFFDVFFELSFDGGLNYSPQGPLNLQSSGAKWTTVEHDLLVDGLLGDQNANRHTDKGGPNCPAPTGMSCVDFYLVGNVTEQHPDAVHTATSAVPEPGSLVLIGLALTAMAGLRRRGARRAQ